MDLSKMTTTELKAVAYDMLVQLETLQANLRGVNQLIKKGVEDECGVDVVEPPKGTGEQGQGTSDKTNTD